MKAVLTKALVTGLLSLFIVSCSVLSFSDNSDRYIIRIEKGENTQVYFRYLTIRVDRGKVTISGRLEKVSSMIVTKGHIDIVVRSPTGAVLEETTTGYTASLNSRRIQRRGGNYFTKVLDTVPPIGSDIVLAFHQNIDESPANRVHDKNIAL